MFGIACPRAPDDSAPGAPRDRQATGPYACRQDVRQVGAPGSPQTPAGFEGHGLSRLARPRSNRASNGVGRAREAPRRAAVRHRLERGRRGAPRRGSSESTAWDASARSRGSRDRRGLSPDWRHQPVPETFAVKAAHSTPEDHRPWRRAGRASESVAAVLARAWRDRAGTHGGVQPRRLGSMPSRAARGEAHCPSRAEILSHSCNICARSGVPRLPGRVAREGCRAAYVPTRSVAPRSRSSAIVDRYDSFPVRGFSDGTFAISMLKRPNSPSAVTRCVLRVRPGTA
jgi:hypothetical protein